MLYAETCPKVRRHNALPFAEICPKVRRHITLSFLGGTISKVLVMEIGWTDVESGGYILVSCAHSNTSVKIDVTDKLANAQNRLLIASKVIIA
jgi:hypothetical protein